MKELHPVIEKIKNKFKNSPYVRERGPHVRKEERSDFDLEKGLNCQLFAHEVLEAITGFQLPSVVLSKEIYEMTGGLFKDVNPNLEDLQSGDIVLFGSDATDYDLDVRSLHIGVIIDEKLDPTVLHFHGNGSDKGLRQNPLSTFASENDREDFRYLWGVRRINYDGLLSFNENEFPTIEQTTEYYQEDAT